MSWLGLGIRIVPKFGNGVMAVGRAVGSFISKAFGTGQKTAKAAAAAGAADKVAKSTGVLGKAGDVAKWTLKNPVKATIVGVGAKTGWDKLNGEKGSVAEVFGKNAKEAVGLGAEATRDVVKGATGRDVVGEAKDKVDSVVNAVTATTEKASGALGGLSNVMSSLVDMIGSGFGKVTDFFSNIGSGRANGLGIAGLIVSAYMLFGRTSILGKIAGSVMGLLLFNCLSQKPQASQAMAQNNPQEDKSQAQERQTNMHR